MDCVDILERLVAFDTVSSRSNRDLARFIAQYAHAQGAHVRTLKHPDMDKHALHIVVGAVRGGGLAFAGHLDTVPVEGQAWTSDPFILTRREGRLQGRGATDMKGFVACCLSAIPELCRMDLPFPVHMLLTYDEEVNAESARLLAADLADQSLLPAACIVGEPTGMRVVTDQKSKLVALVQATGWPAHSSNPAAGLNAIDAVARAVAWLGAQARAAIADGPFDTLFAPPYSTMNVGRIWGGISVNIIPELAGFEVEWRGIPQDVPQRSLAKLSDHINDVIVPTSGEGGECAFSISEVGWYPPLGRGGNAALADWVCRTLGVEREGGVSYATEAGVYQQAGIATIICGPGSIAQAHKPDEWIDGAQLDACARAIPALSAAFGALDG
ncbi:acetylornithine deacetylase [Gluconacetobacter aggeris]|uniref:Acetylornithine deacetylase n=1 Tax=Gluconacetobacter aggeris TaxID=1286186 RepID=A0A7W4IVI2_9PROT|nr:acetylornithine deacetylase [Gluconacetobacter aggeris]MBB2169840.1 acetylornithine deacetylase [Gluconacetobacter aggeris]